LKPLKAKELIPVVCDKTDIPADAVKAIVDFYWQEVRNSISSLKHQRIHLTNLGDFTIKHWKLDERIKHIELFDEKNKQKGLQLINARFKTAETLYDLRAVKKQIAEEQQRADFIKHYKKTLNETKQHHTDLEAQGSDHGGDNE
jgi:hypothetical protein